MPRIEIVLIHGPDGLIHVLQSIGHAPRSGSASLACGLVSSSLRSFGRLLAAIVDLPLRVKIEGPGKFELELGEIPPELAEWYSGLCDMLERNLGDAQADFPQHIHIELRTH